MDGVHSLISTGLNASIKMYTIAKVYAEGLNAQPRAQTFCIEGTIVIDKANSVTYLGCAMPHCNRKVHDSDIGTNMHYLCPTCKQSFMMPMPKYCICFQIVSGNDHKWATAFNTASTALLGVPVATMMDIFADNNMYKPVHSYNLQQAMYGKYLMTIQGSTCNTSFWKGHRSWIVTEFLKVGHSHDNVREEEEQDEGPDVEEGGEDEVMA
ncbi:nucleic acid-binding protein [Dacryopinax primogenitus]|uniref:Nucleic acid-binding protein n=1 Tax=Dacryopinax primogenitus (strain DJM 731) TaxID=1858805 RepID=M5FVP9_DACPD|nr:nucleic acid-binding protein [Dacryopinax primogenitus]EJU00414.1 nucleic acid-binding protein [Dacryopinax primogenitus]